MHSKLPFTILSHLIELSTNNDVPRGGFLFLFAFFTEFLIPNVTINRVGQSVELVQLFDRVFHKMEETTHVSDLWHDFKP